MSIMDYFRSLISRLLIVFLCSSCVNNKTSEVYSTKPYSINEDRKKLAVRSEHYGILNEDDINIYAWRMDSGAPLQTAGYGFFWVCFNKAKIKKMNCRAFDPDKLAYNIRHSELEFHIQGDNFVYDVGQRRAIEYIRCQQMVREWKNLLINENHFCVGVEQHRFNPETKEHLWVYDKFKTKKGCLSSFIGECDKSLWEKCGYPQVSYHDSDNPCLK